MCMLSSCPTNQLPTRTGEITSCIIHSPDHYLPLWVKNICKYNGKTWETLREVIIVLDRVLQEDNS